MNLFTWGEQKVQKFKIFDIAIFKIFMFLFGAIVGAYFPKFFIDFIWYFGVVFVFSLIWLLFKIFSE